MKLTARLNNEEHQLSLEHGDGVVHADIDGRSYEFEVRSREGGELVLFEDTAVFNCGIHAARQSNTFAVLLRGQSYDITIVDPKRLRSGHVTRIHDHESAEIVSPMPGKVVRILVAAGAQVEAGAGIVVVEAMKMQNELKSPRAGKVVSINAAPGDAVNAGDVLSVIE